MTNRARAARVGRWCSPSPELVPGAHGRLRRHTIPSALVVGGVGLAAADVSVGIGWGLVLTGAALAVHPFRGSTSDSSEAGARAYLLSEPDGPEWASVPMAGSS